MKRPIQAMLAIIMCVIGLTSSATALSSSSGQLTVTLVADRLDQPWGVDFLPDGGIVITERGGGLIHITAQGQRISVRGLPKVVAEGQGGLLDVMVPRDFASTRELFFTYSAPQGRGSGTAVAKARLSKDGKRLQGLDTIFEIARGSSGGTHYGSRLVEARDGTLFVTVGDRGTGNEAQNLANHNGSIVRIRRSGVVPPDNPFVGAPGVAPEIYSYGHRNPQGAALDLQGNLWAVEHGARGGDEVNRIEPGVNYGWPVISYGRHYSGAKIGEGTRKRGMAQPAMYWDPSIAPSGMMIYSGKLFPKWKGHIFVGSLNSDFISRISGKPLREMERIKGPETGRVRDIVEGPDGSIWFLSVQNGALFRLTPGARN